ncbi:hypothetical protein A2763_04295 [Candidatus Kaiserbacteria bacterium RIFCSPHIGHO2_01_FULL_54_36]|uniref:Uncharacterized protein n=1 Tax=Candidatus Kaiserbacteria bacterium RIFCSPHIGHO2_01_FULL_54_36 TaxID=1798482 RepID=A0A1F6CM39_9BACT|nr:MAG: hypothetical protein A2763_04295 [Candidatus Kaiserbacteria bacterium RIFCSPHIGHO2_01_FULL_54_36]
MSPVTHRPTLKAPETAKLVVVAAVPVAFKKVKSARVEEAVARRLVAVVRPVLSTEKSVVVAKAAVEEESSNKLLPVNVVPPTAASESKEPGDVVPTPTLEANVLATVVDVETR